jgi:hypothetical protein
MGDEDTRSRAVIDAALGARVPDVVSTAAAGGVGPGGQRSLK